MIILALLILITACFVFVLIFGAPYLPTLNKQIHLAIELARLKPGQSLIDLGSGDGKVLLAAAKAGINGIGYEINPILFIISYLRTIPYRSQVKIKYGNYWRAEWPEADVVFVFLLDRYMKKLDNKLVNYPAKPIKLVSFAFKVPNKKPLINKDGIFVYNYK